MPTGRNQVDYTGIDYDALTVKIDNSTIVYDQTQPGGAAATMIGKAVTWSADDTVALAADGDYVLGVLERVTDDGFATVQNDGFIKFPAGLAAVVTRGTGIVGATGAAAAKGYVRSVNTAVAAELGKMNGRVVNTADPTAVVVDFD